MLEKSKLRSLHSDEALSSAKLAELEKPSTEELINTLAPSRPGSLKARSDGTVLDGHRRTRILSERGVDVDALPREILPKDETRSD